MNREDELLTILAEECAEIVVAVSKIKRFGKSSVYDNETALDRLEKELGDLTCMIDLLQQYDMVSFSKIEEYSAQKAEKLKQWSNLYDS